MCKSKAAGGQRCVGHALQRLAKAQRRKAEVEAAFAAGNATPDQVASARAANWKALVDYASTNAGSEALRNQFAQIPDPSNPAAGLLRSAIDEGALLAQSNRRAEDAYRAAAGKGPLTTATPNTFAQQEAIAAAAASVEAAAQTQNADPLGLRAPSATVPAARPARGGLPTARPSAGASRRPARAQGGTPAASAAEVQRQEAARLREERAAEAARGREERRQASEQARAARTVEVEQRREATRLRNEVKAEISETRKMVEQVWTTRPSAPAGTWSGPDHWRGQGMPATRRANREALAAGRARYGAAFDQAVSEHKGLYSASDVLAACQRLDGQGRERISGAVRHPGWYEGYNHVQSGWVQSARTEAFSNAFGPNERDVIAAQYVQVNLRQVLSGAAAARPRKRPMSTFMAKSRDLMSKARAPRRVVA